MPTSDDNDYRQRLINFFSVLQQKLQDYRKMKRDIDRFLSTNFNVFNRIVPKENALSGIIADLLKPAGSHGQQRIFLKAFLRRITRITHDDLLEQPCKVHPEAFYQNGNDIGRIDILVEFNSGFRIGIENKWESSEGDDQLLRYRNHLNGVSNGKFCLIYLTPDGREPDSISPRDENRLLLMSYRSDILEWLQECVQLCESDKFRWFLRDFMDYISTRTEGRRQMPGEEDIIIRHALESRENLEMTLDICSILAELRERRIREFLKEFKECLERHLDSSEYEYIRIVSDPLTKKWSEGQWEDECRLFKKYAFFGFRKRSWRYQIGIEQEPNGDILYGVRKNIESQEYIPNLKKTIDDKTGMSGKQSSWWEWYIRWKWYIRWEWYISYGDLIRYDEETVKEIVNQLIRILNTAERFIDREVGRDS